MRKVLILLAIGFILIGCNKKLTYQELTTIDHTKSIKPTKDNKLHGIVKLYYGNGKIAEKHSYMDGLLNGESSWYNLSGKEYKMISYKNGKKDGLSKECHYTKYSIPKIKSETYYKNNIKHGKEITYMSKNIIASEKNYINGKLNGVVKIYNYRGKLMRKSLYKNGLKEGQEVEWIESNIPFEKPYKDISNYKNNKLEGKYTRYYPNGKIRFVINYHNGESLGGTTYNKDGSVYIKKENPLKPLDSYKKSSKKVKIIQLKCKSSLGSSPLSISEFEREKAKASGSGKGFAYGYLMKNNNTRPSKVKAYHYCTEETNSKIRRESITCAIAKIFRSSCMNAFGY